MPPPSTHASTCDVKPYSLTRFPPNPRTPPAPLSSHSTAIFIPQSTSAFLPSPESRTYLRVVRIAENVAVPLHLCVEDRERRACDETNGASDLPTLHLLNSAGFFINRPRCTQTRTATGIPQQWMHSDRRSSGTLLTGRIRRNSQKASRIFRCQVTNQVTAAAPD